MKQLIKNDLQLIEYGFLGLCIAWPISPLFAEAAQER